MSRHASKPQQFRPVRAAGRTLLFLGIFFSILSAWTCVLLALFVSRFAALRMPLLGCAGVLLLNTLLLVWSHQRSWRELIHLHVESRQALDDKHELAEMLRRERDFTSTVLDAAGALVVVCDRTGRIRKFNSACERLTGLREENLRDRPLWDLLVVPRDRTVMQTVMQALDGGKVRVRADASQRAEVTWNDRNGQPHRIAFTMTVLLNASGEVEYFVASGVDVTEQRQAQDRLVQLATTDPLTRLVNRATFQNALAFALNPRLGKGAALLFCDLDGFKGVNDTLGHAAGDELLVSVAQRLRRLVRQGDIVARLGGDEFVVLCPGLDEITAHRLADRIRKDICEPYVLTVGGVSVGVSVGVAVAPVGADPEQVLAQADSEMYRVKQKGKTKGWTLPQSAHTSTSPRLPADR